MLFLVLGLQFITQYPRRWSATSSGVLTVLTVLSTGHVLVVVVVRALFYWFFFLSVVYRIWQVSNRGEWTQTLSGAFQFTTFEQDPSFKDFNVTLKPYSYHFQKLSIWVQYVGIYILGPRWQINHFPFKIYIRIQL